MNQVRESYPTGLPPVVPALPSAEPTFLLTWPPSVQLALCLLTTAGVFFLLGRWSFERSLSRDALASSLERQGPCLDLNHATRAELRLLPGLGDSLVQRIIDHRTQNGPFRNVDDLGRVNGIGAKTLARLRPLLFVAEQEPALQEKGRVIDAPVLPSSSSARAAMGRIKKKEPPLTPIDINRADQSELQKLPGIGPKLSQRILNERSKKPFHSVDDLRRVPGIGPKILEKLRPHVKIDAAKIPLGEALTIR